MIRYEIRPIRENEWEMAMQVVWDTFLVFEAPEYPRLGTESFRNFIWDPELKRKFIRGDFPTYAAFVNGVIAGVVSVRDISHVSLLFVDGQFHNNGIATALLRNMFSEQVNRYQIKKMTVNSSPYAVGFYHRVGFKDVNSEQTADGIRFTPMEIDLS